MSGLATLLGGLGLVAVGFGLLSALLAIFQPVTDVAWVVGNLALGVVLLSASLFIGFDAVRDRMRSGEARRVGKYGSSAIASTLLAIVVLGLLAFLAARYPVRYDWTEGRVNTLTDQSLDVIAGLERDAHITAFFLEGEIPGVASLLQRYVYAGAGGGDRGRVALEFVDPNTVPGRVEDWGLDPEALARGLIRVEIGGDAVVVTDFDEANITNALVKLTRSENRKVYFMSGHNERVIANEAGEPAEGKESFGRAADALRNETYHVESLVMASRGDIPEDADAVVIAGPTQRYFEHEIEALRQYVAAGGALLVMIDPRANTNLYDVLLEWGVSLGDDVVVDQVLAILNQATSPFAGQYSQSHPITSEMQDTTLFPMVRSVEILGEGAWSHETIVHTSQDSWAERDLDGWRRSGRAVFDEGDLDGPVPIAIAGAPLPAADGALEPRLVVFGDSDFATNEFLDMRRNRDLFVNSVAWLIGEEEHISIRPHVSRASRFQLDADQFRRIQYISLLVLPEGIAVIGVLAWWSRRERSEG